MSRYRKKPVVVDATQFTEANGPSLVGPGIALRHTPDGQWFLDIDTLEGTMTADIGDWIITGVNGERYPCKPDIFAKTYVAAEDEDPAEDQTPDHIARLLSTKSLIVAAQAIFIALLLVTLALDAHPVVRVMLLVAAIANIASGIAQFFEWRIWRRNAA